MSIADPDYLPAKLDGQTPMTVAVAGATGFVGRALVASLAARGHRVLALSRRRVPAAGADLEAGLHWRQANLFQLRDVEAALEGADVAVYLVHSMLPSARLSQGHFADLDLICADNFARAAKRAAVGRLVYVGGLLPRGGVLSAHLRSRREVERALADHGVPLTVLRAGIVFGPGGSSSELLIRLVERLPVLILPRWCRSKCQPTSLNDLVRTLVAAIERKRPLPAALLGDEPATHVIDVGNEEILAYSDMLRATARAMGRRRWFLAFPAFTPNLSLFWVSMVTGTPLALVGPLVGSLRHDLTVREQHDVKAYMRGPWQSFGEGLESALMRHRVGRRQRPIPTTRVAERARGVVSVQRLPLPLAADAAWVARTYVEWLRTGASWLRPLVRIETVGEIGQAQGATSASAPHSPTSEPAPLSAVQFYVRGSQLLLLELVFAPQRSNAHRQLFYIARGLLTRKTDRATPGRFEFREVLGRTAVLAAIHDFEPRLPWLLYKCTQAIVHGLVMASFGRALGGELRASAEQSGGPSARG